MSTDRNDRWPRLLAHTQLILGMLPPFRTLWRGRCRSHLRQVAASREGPLVPPSVLDPDSEVGECLQFLLDAVRKLVEVGENVSV